MTDGVPTTYLGWLREGTDRLFGAVGELTDADLAEPSLLPGWDRATVLAHLAQNARGLSNLVHWARTGVETPMYPSPEAREAGIAELAATPAGRIRAEAVAADAEFQRHLAELPADHWTNTVRTFRGRPVPATEVPWMRNREVWVHAVDLRCGVTFAAMPADVLAALLDDAASLMSIGPDTVPVTVRAVDAGREWTFGATGSAAGAPVEGELADVCAWVLGRRAAPGVRADPTWPDLPAWL
jgi:maleylpyruvate isomerase